jgi:hypothetical protein
MKVATTPAQRTDSKNARLRRIDLDFGIVFTRCFPFVLVPISLFHLGAALCFARRSWLRRMSVKWDSLVSINLGHPLIKELPRCNFASAPSDLLSPRRTEGSCSKPLCTIRTTWLDRPRETSPPAVNTVAHVELTLGFAPTSAVDTFQRHNETKFFWARWVRDNCVHDVCAGPILITRTGRFRHHH